MWLLCEICISGQKLSFISAIYVYGMKISYERFKLKVRKGYILGFASKNVGHFYPISMLLVAFHYLVFIK